MPTLVLSSRLTRSGKSYGTEIVQKPGYRALHANSTFDISALLQAALELEVKDEDFAFVQDAPATPVPIPTTIPNPIAAASSSQPPPTAAPASKNARFRAYRREKRNQKIREEGHKPRPNPAKDHIVAGAPFSLNIPIEVDELPATSCGYRASQTNSGRREVHDLEHYRTTRGFATLQWDGIEPLPLVEPETGRVFSVLLGRPDDPTYKESAGRVYHKMESARKTRTFKPSESTHARGNFVAINDGIYHGQGSQAPHRLNLGPHEPMLKELREDKDMMRLAHFASAGLAAWAPKLHAYYKTRMDSLVEHLPDLKPNFPKSVFACAAYNFGPIVCCFPHRDCTNCPFGLCAVTALGEYDHKLGGHLILEELGLIIEFPSGSTILIPSAVITHCNTPVQAHERRLSFTQFMPGEVLRFVDNDFKNEVDIRVDDPEAYAALCKKKETRWKEGTQMWSTLESLFEGAQERLEQDRKRKAEVAVKTQEMQEQRGERQRGRKRRREGGELSVNT